MNPFFGKGYISIDQIESLGELEQIFSTAATMKVRVETGEVYEPLKGKSVAVLFYQPSTRTFSSFTAAATRLGAYVTAIHGMEEYSSVAKGETLEDTIRSIYQTTAANLIVLRHPDNSSSMRATEVSPVPIVNAGSGTLEHPTQALLDLFTIQQHFSMDKKLRVVMVGDLLYGRTIKSLAKLLALYGKGIEITLVSPTELRAPRELVKDLIKRVGVRETDSLSGALTGADVVYMTRVQKEWFEKAGKLDEYERLKLQFVLTRHMAGLMKKKAIIMHPLPRVGEILAEVDEDPRARYFEQMRSGLYVRMALLEMILKEG